MLPLQSLHVRHCYGVTVPVGCLTGYRAPGVSHGVQCPWCVSRGTVPLGYLSGYRTTVSRDLRLVILTRGVADDNCVSIADAGAIPPLVMLLGFPSADMQEVSAAALRTLACNGVWRVK